MVGLHSSIYLLLTAPLFQVLPLISMLVLSMVLSKATEASTTGSLYLHRKPHILIIVSDDQGYADLGYTGGAIPTPTLDSLAAEGVKLHNFYVHPVCTPTRASLLSGRYAAHTGLTGPLLIGSPCHLNNSIQTLPQVLATRGYHSILSGKWHLGHSCWEHTPTGKGFNEHVGPLNAAVTYYSKRYWVPVLAMGNTYDWRNGTSPIYPPPAEHSTEAFASALVTAVENRIRSHKDKEENLLMVLALTAPHSPLQSEKRHLEKCVEKVHTQRRQLFCGLMVGVDEAVHFVQQKLEDLGIWKDTVVVYFNDNGGNVWEGGRNYPFRGGKQSAFEGGSRATSFIRFPPNLISHKPTSMTSDTRDPADLLAMLPDFAGLSHVADIMPTLLEMVDDAAAAEAGTEPPLPSSTDPDHWNTGLGYSLARVLLDTTRAPPVSLAPIQELGLGANVVFRTDYSSGPRQDILLAYDTPTKKSAYRYGKWKLIQGNRGDHVRYLEPRPGEWIGFGLNDWILEVLLHACYWWDPPTSGSLDEMFREIVALKVQLESEIIRTVSQLRWPDFEGVTEPALFDLDSDPFEENDLAADMPNIVRMMQGRLAMLEALGSVEGEANSETLSTLNCNWLLADYRCRHNHLEFSLPVAENSAGSEHLFNKMETRSVTFHGPWRTCDADSGEVADGELTLFNGNYVRVIAVYVVVIAELLVFMFCLRKFTKTLARLVF